ncbi:MAG: ABC transporter permease [Planctomycetota bacterium]|jgi:phospholipid/cholesterol/gamma-HCH transport system permease protein
MASLNCQTLKEGKLRFVISGRLDADSTSKLWPEAVKKISDDKPNTLEIDATEINYCDGAGIGLLLELKRRQEENKGSIQIVGLKPDFEQLMTLFDPGQLSKPERLPSLFRRVPEQVGTALVDLLRELRSQISFTGEVCVKLTNTLFHLGSLRLGFLIGVILAFQSAIAMGKYGAEIYVADLVVIVLLRELGPLLTAFVMAARTGSAFAAEIGTMKVNEEIDALTTMGLEPVRFLVIPRILAAVFVTPLLTMFNNLFGIIGCGLVMISIGFSPITVMNQIQGAGDLTDLFGGLAKTLVFGSLIASIGCLCGLQTKTGASAVGDSATRAVVTSIIAIVVADGVFAVIYYFMGI